MALYKECIISFIEEQIKDMHTLDGIKTDAYLEFNEQIKDMHTLDGIKTDAYLEFNPNPNNPCFLYSPQLMKSLWEKEKMLVTSIFLLFPQ